MESRTLLAIISGSAGHAQIEVTFDPSAGSTTWERQIPLDGTSPPAIPILVRVLPPGGALPKANVDVGYVSSPAGEAAFAPVSPLTFTIADVQNGIYKQVTLKGADDTTDDGNVNYAIQFTMSCPADNLY